MSILVNGGHRDRSDLLVQPESAIICFSIVPVVQLINAV